MTERAPMPSPATHAALTRARANAPGGILGPGSLSRSDRERLRREGWLVPVMRGWHRLRDPELESAAPTPAAVILRRFLAAYLPARLGERWCLGPLSSLQFHLEPDLLPARVVVIAAECGVTIQSLPGPTTLTIYPDADRLPQRPDLHGGLRLMACEEAVAALPSSAWRHHRDLLRRAIASVKDWHRVIAALPAGRRQAAADTLGAGVRRLGTPAARAACARALALAGGARAAKPPRSPRPLPHPTPRHGFRPAAGPVRPADLPAIWALWQQSLVGRIPLDPFARPALVPHLGRIADALADDTWHSLRLSGLRVTRDMVRAGRGRRPRPQPGDLWPPEDPAAAIGRSAPETHLPGEIDPMLLIAIQGHLAALERVKHTILALLQGANLVDILPKEIAGWYAALMRPSTQAGLLPIGQLRRPRRPADPVLPVAHRPCTTADIGPALDLLYRLIPDEPNPAHRAVLAHLGILWIQPWSLGNGRMARLFMNTLLAAGGQPWISLPGDRRRAYLQAVERALVRGNAAQFARLLLRA